MIEFQLDTKLKQILKLHMLQIKLFRKQIKFLKFLRYFYQLFYILSPTTETAQRGFVPQPTTTSVVVVDQSIKWNEVKALGIDEVHVVKTTKSREVIKVKSRDYPAPSGRSNVSPPRTSGTPQYKSPHVNLYRSAPSINTRNSGDPDDSGNPYDSSKTVDTGKEPKKEIVSYEFATPANFKPPLNRVIKKIVFLEVNIIKQLKNLLN